MQHAPHRSRFSFARPTVLRPGLKRASSSPEWWALIAAQCAKPLPTGAIVGWLTAYLGILQLALWRFLDFAPVWFYGVGIAAIILLAVCVARYADSYLQVRPSVGTFGFCLAFSLALFALGGEGRLFYANIDWQIRYALIRDMAINPWPFAYSLKGVPDLLRAQLGMFFVPALAWKMFGHRAADIALLLQNSLILASILSLGSRLFETAKARILALVVMTAFSGLDIVGQFFTDHWQEHRESWGASQYSSNITLAFWVPHHALTAWFGAMGFLLWYRRQWPVICFVAPLPLFAIWSPLALIGLLPFAAFAGFRDLRDRNITRATVLAPLLSSLIALPSLLYLGAAGDAVGVRRFPMKFTDYASFELIETLPFLILLLVRPLAQPKDRPLLLLVAACLLIYPFVQIGQSGDFAMRVSIPALAILAYLTAQQLMAGPGRRVRIMLIVALGLGAFTGASEIERSVLHPPAPPILCSFVRTWGESFGAMSTDTYLAPVERLPALIRPNAPAIYSPTEPQQCWHQPWYHPTGA